MQFVCLLSKGSCSDGTPTGTRKCSKNPFEVTVWLLGTQFSGGFYVKKFKEAHNHAFAGRLSRFDIRRLTERSDKSSYAYNFVETTRPGARSTSSQTRTISIYFTCLMSMLKKEKVLV